MVRLARDFNESDLAIAEKLFQKIRDLSANGPYHLGVTRPSYSAVETATLQTLEAFAHQEGLLTYYDHAANLWIEAPLHADVARCRCTHLQNGEHECGTDECTKCECKHFVPAMATEPAVWIGSHVDSVPQGGNYDGLAGVVAGLLCLRKIAQRGLRKPVRVVALRGEESAWFGAPYLGAKALLGKLTKEDLARTFQRSGEPLYEHMKNCGAAVERIREGVAAVAPSQIIEYWELHIEQGPVLVNAKQPVGAVTNIRGNTRLTNIEIVGLEGHSGTVPRELRHDAVFAFAEFITTLDVAWEGLLKRGHDLVVTSGIVETDATVHGITRIPGNVRFCLEWRSQSGDVLEMFSRVVAETAGEVSALRGVKFVFDKAVKTASASLDEKLVMRTFAACADLDIPVRLMPSGAGHDAAIFANEGIPTGMIFVRNENGSHNPHEAMDMKDFMSGVEALYSVVTKKV